MKKILCMLFLLLCFVMPASAANFVEIHRDEKWSIQLDFDSLPKESDLVKLKKLGPTGGINVWIRWVPQGEQVKELERIYGRPVGYMLWNGAYSEDAKSYRDWALLAYSPRGDVVDNTKYPGQWTSIPPGTYHEMCYDYILSLYPSFKK